MPTHDAVSWGVIIRGYVKCGQGQQALELSKEMQCDGVEVVPVTFVAMLKCKFMSA
jgi:pentatricopeptide repeat protein